MEKLNLFKNKIYLSLFTFLLCSQCFYAQELSDSIVTAFKTYAKSPRETNYTHLNKSVFVKGETMGFTSYVLDKHSKKTSLVTSNLYCIIEDNNNKIVKSKLIKIEEGVGNGIFNIDSLFTSGQYTFKAYTNWQKNFDEQNFHTQTFKVIDNKSLSKNNNKALETKIDAQFLPESGHAITNVINTFGIAIKNGLGYGVPNIEGVIVNNNKEVITTFKVNKLGIGVCEFTPYENQNYTAEFDFNNKKHVVKINNIQNNGIVLSLKNNGDTINATIKTNKNTLLDIDNEIYNLTIHNGSVLKVIEFYFNGNTEINSVIKQLDLEPGINIFTIFDSYNTPILERLYFNYNGINILASSTPIVTKSKDSVKITLPFTSINTTSYNNVSVSVLPSSTKAYNHHHNIVSYTYLQPYLKSYIENAKYYFTNSNENRQLDLDNLLITQGWSSYNWQNIFTKPPKINYALEKGINFKAESNTSKTGQFLMFPMRKSNSNTYNINNGIFEQQELYPTNNETLKIAEIAKKGVLKTPKLYLQFYPSEVPTINNKIAILPSKYNYPNIGNSLYLESNLSKTLQLEEVIVEGSKKQTRLEELRRHSFGSIEIWDEKIRKRTPNIISYLSKWFYTYQNQDGDILINNRTPNSWNNNEPLVFINDTPIMGFNQLTYLKLDLIDYVVVNKSGIGEGIRAGAGVIRIYTDPTIELRNNYGSDKTYQAYKFPLTFTEDKTFYKPLYASYTSDFYNQYGVIEWFPKVALNDKGELFLKIPKNNTEPINLYIEGIANNGGFISQVKTITLN